MDDARLTLLIKKTKTLRTSERQGPGPRQTRAEGKYGVDETGRDCGNPCTDLA